MQHQKNWFTISEAAKHLGVSPDTLRRWEKAKKIPAPTRTAGGARRYSKDLLNEILGKGKEEKKASQPTKPESQGKSSNKKQLLIGLIAAITTMAIFLPLLFFLL
ncbi:MAG TPA: MerR family DNA-binding transcriptional regulator [Patescibacteria group bacterium]|nr:MerR family DNA-binding transcriptional regulator [Patescibacteria group bacterium]